VKLICGRDDDAVNRGFEDEVHLAVVVLSCPAWGGCSWILLGVRSYDIL